MEKRYLALGLALAEATAPQCVGLFAQAIK